VYLVNVVEGLVATDGGTSETTSVERLRAVVDTTIPRLDLAILKVNPEEYGIVNFEFLGFGNSDSLKEGQDIAICAFIPDSFKLPKAFISRGLVSTIRPKTFNPTLNNEVDIIQMDLNISKGTSGGPIFMIDTGRVIAIQNAGLFEFAQSSQTPYAIAIETNQVIPLLDSLRIPYDRR
jgi:S1-C subfamily serine protease